MTEEEKKILEELRQKEKKEESAKKRNNKRIRKGLFTKIIIVAVFTYLFCFTKEVLDVFKATGSEPSTLITCVFAILGLECGVLGWIKSTKIKKGE